MQDIEKELSYREYILREEYLIHAPFDPEMEFYNAVKSGDRKKVESFLTEPFCKKEGLGSLSDNPLQNFKYHFAITAAILTRECIKAGLMHEEAYTLSDLYIHKADKCISMDALSELHRKMVRDYTKRMHSLTTNTVISRHIIKCLNYIYDHIHERITLEDIASETMLSSAYLSRLFKKEMHMPVSEYISRKKIETAKNMIRYSDYSIAEISNILAFPSQSYFIKVFRKYTGTTPGSYNALRHDTEDNQPL
ncbi:AraC-type DNA-binding protein [Eubacterium ruminantium]|nr:AraC-type DNA-binding protein [Eubacterium ruminantium]